MTTKTTKIADRYAALAAIAQTLDGVAFTPSKKPTTKDCDDLSAMIDAHRAALAAVEDVENEAPLATPVGALVEALETLDALDGGTSAAVFRKDNVDERAAAIEAKRADARRRFETATKATTAHGYALIAAATADGDRMENLRAKLVEMPEAVRAGACRLAAEKLVQPGSSMQSDLRALFNEQPVAERVKTGRGAKTIDEVKVGRIGAGAQIVIRSVDLKSKIGTMFKIERSISNGKIVITLVEQ
jgi:hypothetical protein